MAALDITHVPMLWRVLETAFVPHLPPLIDLTRPAAAQLEKNRARSLAALAIAGVTATTPAIAAASVVDDFDDYGIDAIYLDPTTNTLYIAQGKLRPGANFDQADAQAFCRGIRKLLQLDLNDFNVNVQNRRRDIELALENCDHISLIVAYIGPALSQHAEGAIQELLDDPTHGEQRFTRPIVRHDAAAILAQLRSMNAPSKVEAELWVSSPIYLANPRPTYIGVASISDLITLHDVHGPALYQRNVRMFLGPRTDVNDSIRTSLANEPESFFYFNNGVTALVDRIEPKGSRGNRKKLKLRGVSVVNGAQTIAAAAEYAHEGHDTSQSQVLLTLIQAGNDSSFGKKVTRARNHQNSVLTSDFAALDDEQERIRRDLAHLGFQYSYQASGSTAGAVPNVITIHEAAQALALFQADPRIVFWLKREPSRLLDVGSPYYALLFGVSPAPIFIVNAVSFYRYVMSRAGQEADQAQGHDRLTYRNGNYAMGWILAKRVVTAVSGVIQISEVKLAQVLGQPFDDLRQKMLASVQARLPMGPLALFRNQTELVPLLQKVQIEYFGLVGDGGVAAKIAQQPPNQPYPKHVFDYLALKAPGIGGLV